LLGTFSGSLYAQQWEVHPYVGGFFPNRWANVAELKNEGIYGLKAGFFFMNRSQLEGNFGYINHFEFERTDPKSRGWLWDVNYNFSFLPERMRRVDPYAAVGVGGLTASIGDPEQVFDGDTSERATMRIQRNGTVVREVVLEDGDTFFAFSYGGGVRAPRLWRALGLRGDVRGRTLPNFFGRSTTWLEFTGGLTFTWGER
jgi:hypothetical protein